MFLIPFEEIMEGGRRSKTIQGTGIRIRRNRGSLGSNNNRPRRATMHGKISSIF